MGWLVILAIFYSVVMAVMYISQRSHLYFPFKTNQSPADMGLAGINAVTISTIDGEKLQAWHLAAQTGQPSVLFFHGNAGFIGHRAERLSFFRKKGIGALFVSYRGYGASTGSPTEQGLINDALAAYDWLVDNNIAPRQIAVLGESLGSAVAVQLAARRPVLALVLEAPFTSVADVARRVYWWLPVNLLLKDRFETIQAIKHVNAPVMIVHGERDEIINISHGRRLFEVASQPKELSIIKGGTHNGFSNEDVWIDELAFIRKYAQDG